MTNRTPSLYLFIFVLCIYALTAGGHYGGDGFWNYLTAQSLVRDGNIIISDEIFTMPEMQRQYESVLSSGRHHSKYGLGLPLVEIPFYLIGHFLAQLLPNIPADYLTMFTTSMTNVILCGFSVLIFFFIVQSFDPTPTTTWWLTIAFAFGTLLFPYAGYGFSEPLVGLGLLLTTLGLTNFKHKPTAILVILSGIGFSIAILTKLYTFVLLPILILYLRRNKASGQAVLVFLLPIIATSLLIALHNVSRYGNLFHTGYHLDILAQKGGYFTFTLTQIITSLYGLLFSTGRGIIFFMPLIFLFPIAYTKFRSSHPNEARLFLGLILVQFAFLLPMIDWHGGSCWGPRYLLPIIPFCIFPLSALTELKWTRGLTILGLLMQLPGVLMNPHLFVRFAQDKQIGDIIFSPDRIGDLLFSPYLSPILGGYYQFTSAIYRLITGQSLHYTISSSTEHTISASLENYDLIDLWWANALRTDMLSTTLSIVLIFGVICLIFIAIYSARQFTHHLHQKESDNEQTKRS